MNPTEWKTQCNGETWWRDSEKVAGQWGLIIPTFDGCEGYLCLQYGPQILVGILPTLKEAKEAVDGVIDKPYTNPS